MSVLQLENISKSFGAIQALSEVTFSVDAGEIVGLMGDNGAGKSTLIRLIAGNHAPTSGVYSLNDQPVHLTGPADARRHGVDVVYQDLAICDNLTAAANVFLGREIIKKIGPFSYLDHGEMRRRSTEIFRSLKTETRARDLVLKMSGGQRQAVAIARTCLAQSQLVLMDEPTAAISVRQVAEVLALIRRLRDQGTSIILVSHRMPDVFEVCDRVIVMRRGRKVADKTIASTSPQEVTALITGAQHSA